MEIEPNINLIKAKKTPNTNTINLEDINPKITFPMKKTTEMKYKNTSFGHNSEESQDSPEK